MLTKQKHAYWFVLTVKTEHTDITVHFESSPKKKNHITEHSKNHHI